MGGVTAATDAIVMNLHTRPTRARRSHFPKVILGIKGQYPGRWQELQPNVSCLQIRRTRLISTKVTGIQALRIHPKLLRQTLPRHFNRLLLEVIPKRPVAEHFEEGVVVDVLAHVVEVVVFSAGTNALLGVDGTLQGGHGKVGVTRAQKQGLVLIHARIGKQQGWIIVGHHGTRRPRRMPMLFGKIVQKRPSHPFHGPLQLLLLLHHHTHDIVSYSNSNIYIV
mmetsp:Transcript_11155/g.20342  ORF Transcript_11155/g.20342 Transcript_11155/m.20342 type:complete len:223 (+) Transcript_11155:1-669(+)